MNQFNNGAIIKNYRTMLKISQKELAGTRMSHSMISLIESGKIQLTTVSAVILADSLNNIAAQKGIELNLSLKDILSDNKYEMVNKYKEEINEALIEKDFQKLNRIYESAKNDNMFDIMAEIKIITGDNYFSNESYEDALECYKKAEHYFSFMQDRQNTSISIIYIARCYNKLEKSEKAETLLENLKYDYVNKCSNQNLINICNYEYTYALIQNKKYTEAAKIIDNIIKNKSFSALVKSDFYLFKAEIFIKENKYIDAMKIYKKILNLDIQDKYIIYHHMSIINILVGNIEEAKLNISFCINLLSSSLGKSKAKIALTLAEDYWENKIEEYSIPYYEFSIANSNIDDEENNKITSYQKIFKILKPSNIKQFQKYSLQIEEMINDKKDDKHKLNYIVILTEYYIKTNQIYCLERFINTIETKVI
ncbi:helix-turn-helix transcriptional regulator [Clostridium sp. 19966]|uniref:helix-turn-helix domain-containing protein n=1 Tax=Clostridium sp. 19966 TaxID=2768166 RepID=UPI0028DDBF61|nr:helix-turn-helix transcriptional regulator [Clostridium sp. 19966]MDT8716341.1 helix-turn-helix transcriptional regulator [Clostridium sp. 19966]